MLMVRQLMLAILMCGSSPVTAVELFSSGGYRSRRKMEIDLSQP